MNVYMLYAFKRKKIALLLISHKVKALLVINGFTRLSIVAMEILKDIRSYGAM